jgi:hypothetical protein
LLCIHPISAVRAARTRWPPAPPPAARAVWRSPVRARNRAPRRQENLLARQAGSRKRSIITRLEPSEACPLLPVPSFHPARRPRLAIPAASHPDFPVRSQRILAVSHRQGINQPCRPRTPAAHRSQRILGAHRQPTLAARPRFPAARLSPASRLAASCLPG